MRWVHQIHNEHLDFFSIRISQPAALPVLYRYGEPLPWPPPQLPSGPNLLKSQIPRFAGECR